MILYYSQNVHERAVITREDALLVSTLESASHHNGSKQPATTKIKGFYKFPVSSRTVLQDLERCSRALGMTEQSLLLNRVSIVEVSRRAEIFLEKIAVMLPENYLRKYSNPCWMAEEPKGYPGWEKRLMVYFNPEYGRIPKDATADTFARLLSKPIGDTFDGSKRLNCLPSFFLAGFPKCASTTVHDALGKHPQIVPPVKKEPHYWARGLTLSRTEYISASFMAYILSFKQLSTRLVASPMDLITYDGSQSTLWDSDFFYKGQEYCAMPAVISRVLPNAKFIIVMRNPVARCYSHFMMSKRLSFGDQVKKWPRALRENGAAIFHAKVMAEMENFNDCRTNKSLLECVNVWATSKAGGHSLSVGLYAVHIRKWLQFYPRENFLFIRTEDISSNSTELVSQITEFLGISPVSEEMARGMFEKESNVFDANAHDLPPIDEKTKLLLGDFYRPFNEELAAITNNKKFLQ